MPSVVLPSEETKAGPPWSNSWNTRHSLKHNLQTALPKFKAESSAKIEHGVITAHWPQPHTAWVALRFILCDVAIAARSRGGDVAMLRRKLRAQS